VLRTPPAGVVILFECLLPLKSGFRSLWLKAMAVSDPSERDTLLFEFRDAVHECLDQLKAEAKKLPTAS
jgi:hypothetical protein